MKPRGDATDRRNDAAYDDDAASDRLYSDPLLAPWTPGPARELPPTRPRPAKPRRRPTRPARRRDRWLLWWRHAPLRARLLAAIVLVALFFSCAAPGLVAARLALDAADGAHRLSDLQALLAGGLASALDPASLARARTDLDAAHADFSALQTALGPAQIITDRSASWSDDARIVRLAVLLTGAGQSVVDALTNGFGGLLAHPFASGGPAITPAQLVRAQGDLVAAQAALDAAAPLARQIDPASLRGLPGGAKLGPLLAKLPDDARTFDDLRGIVDDLPALLGVGAPTSFLILALDRSELRTGGGFIGNFGTLTLDGGRMGKLSLQDTYPLDAAYFTLAHQQAPAAYPWWPYRYGSQVYGWGLRDSDLAPDFPTDAAAALTIARAVGNRPPLSDPYAFAGVVAITATVMAQIIQLDGGSLTLPEYPRHVITPANLETTIHCFQLGACQAEQPILQPGDLKSGDRKRFTAYLGQALVDQVRGMAGQQMKALLNLVAGDLASKDIQIAFADPGAEQALIGLGAAANVPAHPGDTLFVTDTNIGGNKANAFVTQQEQDIVTLLPDGGALHHLLIRTIYQRQGALFEGSTGQTAYWDYRRVYLPANAQFLGLTGAIGGGAASRTALTTTSDTPNRSMVGAGNTIGDGAALGQCRTGAGDPPGTQWQCAAQTRDTYVFWYTPDAWQTVNGHIVYHDLVQRQAGSVVTLTVYVDASHVTNPDAAPLLASAVRNYDVPDARAPTGYDPRTDAAWTALGAHATLIFNGPLARDEALTWSN